MDTWTVAHLEKTLSALQQRGGDSQHVELKLAQNELPTDIGATLCAFANSPEGGTLILGVQEKPFFQVTGVENAAKLEQALSSHARTTVDPPPHLTPTELQLEGKTVLVVDVSPVLSLEPATYKKVVYLRQSDGNYRATPTEITYLRLRRCSNYDPAHPELNPVENQTRDDLDPDLLRMFLQRARAANKRVHEMTDDEILRSYGVLSQAGAPTRAGLYALGKFPQGPLPALSVTVAKRLPSSMRELKDRRDFDGPLPELLADIMAWLATNLPQITSYDAQGNMRDTPLVPLDAARELVTNALVHRDLGVFCAEGKSVQIRIFRDRLLVQSPGGLTVSLDSLKSRHEHTQSPVNPHLYRICKLLLTPDGARVIEGEGGGIHAVYAAMERAGLPQPRFNDASGTKFEAVLEFAPQDSEAGREQLPQWRGDEKSGQRSLANTKLAESGATAEHAAKEILAESTGANCAFKAESAQTRRAPIKRANFAATREKILELLGDGPASLEELSRELELKSNQVRYVLRAMREAGEVTMRGRQGMRQTTYALARGDETH